MSADSPSPFDPIAHNFAWVRRFAADHYGEDAADDVAQETMARAYRSGPRHDKNIRAWLATIAHNIARGNARKKARRLELRDAHIADFPSEEAPDLTADEILTRSESQDAIADCVRRLPKALRVATLARYQEGLSYEQIARIQNVSSGAVRHLVDRAHDDVRAMLRRKYGDDYLLPCIALLPNSVAARRAAAQPGQTPAPLAAKPGATVLAGPGAWFASVAAIAIAVATAFVSSTQENLVSAKTPSGHSLASLASDAVETLLVPTMRTPKEGALPAFGKSAEMLHVEQPFNVQHPDGNPAVGVEVIASSVYQTMPFVFDPQSMNPVSQHERVFRSVTDSAGVARITVPKGEVLHVAAFAHALSWSVESIECHGREVKPLLPSLAAALHLDVVDGQGNPIPFPEAVVFSTQHRSGMWKKYSGQLSGDSAGRVIVGHLTDECLLHVFAPGYMHRTIPVRQLETSQSHRLQVKLERGLSAIARFSDADSGMNVAGVEVLVIPPDANRPNYSVFPTLRSPDAISDSNGEVALTSIPFDRQGQVRLKARGYRPATIDIADLLQTGEWPLEPYAQLAVRVAGPRGAVDDAIVSIWDSTGNPASARIASDGLARFGTDCNLVSGPAQIVVTSSEGSLTTTQVIRSGASDPITLSVARSHEVVARVRDHRGKPVRNALVSYSYGPAKQAQQQVAQLRTDNGGMARYYLEPGMHNVDALYNGVSSDPIRATIGAHAKQRVDIEIKREAKVIIEFDVELQSPGWIQLTPTLQSGLETRWVRLHENTMTNSTPVEPGQYEARLFARRQYRETLPSLRLGPIVVEDAPGQVQHFKLQPDIGIDANLLVQAPTHWNQDLCRVFVYGLSQQQKGVYKSLSFPNSALAMNADGTVQLRGLPAGWYRVILRGAGKRQTGAQLDILLTADQANPVARFADAPARGQLSPALRNSVIDVYRGQGKKAVRLHTLVYDAASGSFQTDHLDAGEYELRDGEGVSLHRFVLCPQGTASRDLGLISGS